MDEQGEFMFGGKREPRRSRPDQPERLFYADLLEPEMAAKVDELRAAFIRLHGLRGSLIPPHRLHLSFMKFGDCSSLSSQVVEVARRVGRRIDMPSFEIRFTGVQSFEGPPPRMGEAPRRPLVLVGDCAPIKFLNGTLVKAMEGFGRRPSEGISPHVTLLYGPDIVPFTEIRPIRLTVRRVLLIHSERGLSNYNILDRWPLH